MHYLYVDPPQPASPLYGEWVFRLSVKLDRKYMSYSSSLRLPAFAVAVPKRRVAALKEGADLAILWLLRLALLAFVTYDGALIVRNVTRAMCDASSHPAPAWTRS